MIDFKTKRQGHQRKMLHTVQGNKRQRIPKGQSRTDNPEIQATLGTEDTRRRQTKQKTQRNMCLTPLCANKQK